MPIISLGGKKFTYLVKKKLTASLSLHLRSTRSFIITCPYLTPGSVINRFLQSHSSWILKNSQKFSSPKKLSSLKTLSILGHSYQIILNKSQRDSLVIFADEKKIYANSISFSAAHLKHLFDTKFRPLAQKLIKEKLLELRSQHHFSYKKITVKNQSSLFGSCSSAGNLNFNWQIVFFPPDKFQHILLHELVHLSVKNHSRHFWQTLAQCDPDWRQNRLWLKKEGPRHFLISRR